MTSRDLIEIGFVVGRNIKTVPYFRQQSYWMCMFVYVC